jgi:hypothetical protein
MIKLGIIAELMNLSPPLCIEAGPLSCTVI